MNPLGWSGGRLVPRLRISQELDLVVWHLPVITYLMKGIIFVCTPGRKVHVSKFLLTGACVQLFRRQWCHLVVSKFDVVTNDNTNN